MPQRCKHYIAKTLLHLAGGFAIAGVSSVMPLIDIVKPIIIKNPLAALSIMVVLIAAVIFLCIFLTSMPAGTPMKYFLAVLLAFIVGQALHPTIQGAMERHTLTKTIVLTSGVFLGMATLGFYDTLNLFGFNRYLFSGLLGLLISTLFFVLLTALNVISSSVASIFSYVLSVFGATIFSFYIAHDIKAIKLNAIECKGTPDYINESFKLFIEVVNVFSSISRLN
jgi:hypothetical protein